MHVQRALPEEDRDAELELIALAIADTAAGLRFEDRGVYAATPLIPRWSVWRERRADGEASLCHCYEQGTDRRARPSVDAIGRRRCRKDETARRQRRSERSLKVSHQCEADIGLPS